MNDKIKEIVYDDFNGCMDEVVFKTCEQFKDIIHKNIYQTFEQIKNEVTEHYNAVTNRPKEVGVKEYLQYLIVELQKKQSSSHKRLYRNGFQEAINILEQRIKGHS